MPGENPVGHRNVSLYFDGETTITDGLGGIQYVPNGHLRQHYPDEDMARERRERRVKTASVQAQLSLLTAPLSADTAEDRAPAAAVAGPEAAWGASEGETEGGRETLVK